MKTTIAILTLSIATALAQKPVPAAPKAAAAASTAPARPLAPRPATPGQPATPKVEPDILDLKPTRVKFEEDGLFMPKIEMRSPKARVLISEPNYFKMSDSAATPTFISTEDRGTTVHLLTSGTPVLPLENDERKKAVRDSILATAPKDADRVEISNESENPFPVNGWKTYQFTMSYGLFGQTFKKQVVFIRLHQFQELQFVAQAPENLFPKAAGAIGQILNSWYREPLNLVAGANGANGAKPTKD